MIARLIPQSRRSTGPRGGAAATMLCATIVALPVRAQPRDEGPIVIGERRGEEVKAFSITDLTAQIEFIARFTRDEFDRQDGRSTVDKESIFFENLILDADAYVVHPNVLDLDLFTRIELSQQDESSDTLEQDSSGDETFLEFDVAGTFIRNGDMPVTVFGRQTQNLVDRQFGGSLDSTTTEFGASALVRSDLFPSNFRIARLETEQRNQAGRLDFAVDQDSFTWHTDLNAFNATEFTWDYSFQSVEERGSLTAGNRFDRHEAELLHRIHFGEDDANWLRSRFEVFSQQGDFANDRVELDERLQLRHSDNFRTDYSYIFRHRSRSASDQTDHRAWVGFTHQLYDSLTSNARAGVNHLTDSEGFESTEYFINLDEEYRKRVPYGRLLGNLNLAFDEQSNSGRGGRLQIIDDRRTFVDPNPIVLARSNIVISSIVITDLPGIQVFVEGIDYEVTNFANRVEIRRLIGGDIDDGETVLIDFDVGPEPSNTITTATVGLGLRYDIDVGPLQGLGLFTRYINVDRSIDTSQPSTFVINDTSDFFIGADYRVWRLYFEAEYQTHDEDISPFDAFRLRGEYRHRFGPRSAFILDAHYEQVDFTNENEETEFLRVTGRYRDQLTRQLTLNLEAVWREEDNRSFGTTTAFEQNAELIWSHRKTEVFLQARNVFTETPVNDNTFQLLQVGFRRTF